MARRTEQDDVPTEPNGTVYILDLSDHNLPKSLNLQGTVTEVINVINVNKRKADNRQYY